MNRRERYIVTRAGILAVLSLMTVASAFGQEATTNQTLTLQVFETNRIDINQRAVTMVIDQASLETGAPIEATNEDGSLFWITNGENKKITVASNNAAPRFLVKVNALDVSGSSGVAAPEVNLNDNTTKDFVVGVSRSWGKCKIRFVASARVSDGVGTETHLITYTITGS